MSDTNEKILDWDKYIETARRAVTEGVVLLKNDDHALPFEKGTRLSVFGRSQNVYYKSGFGSGGMVNVSEVIDIPQGLIRNGGVILNEELRKVYADWEEEHPADHGEGWGNEAWSQPEMPVTDELCEQAAKVSEAALIVIGRTAGEDRDSKDEEGSYQLTKTELDMIGKVCRAFSRTIVVLNVGAPIDMRFVKDYAPAAVLYAWQGGMIGGDGVADVLCGNVSPSGKLTDTIAYAIEDHPSAKNFGDRMRNIYAEDIYVGYRYFETFAKDRVLYPFGFGLSYTTFSIEKTEITADTESFTVRALLKVKNIGERPGKEVVQIYARKPQGKLGQPERSLIAFHKTKELAPGETENVSIELDIRSLASYDDSGVTGNRYAYVLEAGEYELYIGSDVRSAVREAAFTIPETIITKQMTSAYAPTTAFDRLRPVANGDGTFSQGSEPAPLAQETETPRAANFFRGDIAGQRIKNISFRDVITKNRSLDDFVYDLSDEDLTAIVSGEGMGSPRVTPGTASGFGAVTAELEKLMLPTACCADGPSGIRMDCGVKAFSLPNGTLLACTWNEALVEELFTYTGMELLVNHVDCLLGPGMNIHRHPLNGRNFEYFSEDPYVTGVIATAFSKGLKKNGVYAVPKHFIGNNQETGRRTQDSVISERAMREIYLKGFEMVVKNRVCDIIMTTYGIVNNIRTTESYDLATRILREEWGFVGVVMTDWWAYVGTKAELTADEAYTLMVGSQNDVFMVVAHPSEGEFMENSLRILKQDDEEAHTYRANLRRSAANICRFLKKTEAMKRLAKEKDFPTVDAFDKPIDLAPAKVKVINRPEDDEAEEMLSMTFTDVEEGYETDLTYKESKQGSNFAIPLNMLRTGTFEFALTGSSELTELAQIPVSLFINGTPLGTFTFNGTGGKPVTLTKNFLSFGRTALLRLYVGAAGVKLIRAKITFKSSELNLAL